MLFCVFCHFEGALLVLQINPSLLQHLVMDLLDCSLHGKSGPRCVGLSGVKINLVHQFQRIRVSSHLSLCSIFDSGILVYVC